MAGLGALFASADRNTMEQLASQKRQPGNVRSQAPEDVVVRIYIDRQVVEMFVNNRQAIIAHHRNYHGQPSLNAFAIGAATILKKVEVWQTRPANAGFLKAMKDRIREPQTFSHERRQP